MAAIEKEAKLLGSIHHPSIPVMHEIIKGEVGIPYSFLIVITVITINDYYSNEIALIRRIPFSS